MTGCYKEGKVIQIHFCRFKVLPRTIRFAIAAYSLHRSILQSNLILQACSLKTSCFWNRQKQLALKQRRYYHAHLYSILMASSLRIRNDLNNGLYFVTCTVKNWYYIFDRCNRWNILLDSLKFCQQHKNLKIYAWVFMLNHIHLLVESGNMNGFLRDFKTFTSKEMKQNILANEPRLLTLFESKNGFQFWQPTNMPEKIETIRFFEQKYDYIHFNPVRKSYVNNPAHWRYSSANPENLLELSYLES